MIVKSKINAILFHVLAHNKSAENLIYQLPAFHDQSTTNSNLLKYYLSIVVSIHYTYLDTFLGTLNSKGNKSQLKITNVHSQLTEGILSSFFSERTRKCQQKSLKKIPFPLFLPLFPSFPIKMC